MIRLDCYDSLIQNQVFGLPNVAKINKSAVVIYRGDQRIRSLGRCLFSSLAIGKETISVCDWDVLRHKF